MVRDEQRSWSRPRRRMSSRPWSVAPLTGPERVPRRSRGRLENDAKRRERSRDEVAGQGTNPRVGAGQPDPLKGTHNPSVEGSIPSGPTTPTTISAFSPSRELCLSPVWHRVVGASVIRRHGNRWQVTVYAGADPLTGRERRVRGSVPATPYQQRPPKEARELEARLLLGVEQAITARLA